MEAEAAAQAEAEAQAQAQAEAEAQLQAQAEAEANVAAQAEGEPDKAAEAEQYKMLMQSLAGGGGGGGYGGSYGGGYDDYDDYPPRRSRYAARRRRRVRGTHYGHRSRSPLIYLKQRSNDREVLVRHPGKIGRGGGIGALGSDLLWGRKKQSRPRPPKVYYIERPSRYSSGGGVANLIGQILGGGGRKRRGHHHRRRYQHRYENDYDDEDIDPIDELFRKGDKDKAEKKEAEKEKAEKKEAESEPEVFVDPVTGQFVDTGPPYYPRPGYGGYGPGPGYGGGYGYAPGPGYGYGGPYGHRFKGGD